MAMDSTEIFKTSQAKYLTLCNKINKVGYDVTEFNRRSQVAKDKARSFFETEYRLNNGGLSPPQDILDELELCLNESRNSLTEFKTVNGDILEISSSILKVSKELPFLEQITKSYSGALPPGTSGGTEIIKEVRWIAALEIILDTNLSGKFWSGKNLVLCTRKLCIKGSGGARVIDVSGENGESGSSLPPLTSNLPGAAGKNGVDGEHGENGGNVAIIAVTIDNAQNLHVISNGGSGGDGQPGGNGADGKQGVNGNDTFKMSMEDLKAMFPSPAKLSAHNRQENLHQGYLSLKELADGNVFKIKNKKVCNENSHCYMLETAEGAFIQYGYFQGALGSSFYLWCQGASGINGQPGGLGGYGGRGGEAGMPGNVYISTGSGSGSSPGPGGSSKKPVQVIDILITGDEGSIGVNGELGTAGKTVGGATHVKQGTDFAIVDPYAGPSSIFGGYKLKEFSGNLKIKLGREQDDGNWKTFQDHAYCPLEERYISFLQETKEREVLKIYGAAEKPREQGKVQKAASPKSINIDEVLFKRAAIISR